MLKNIQANLKDFPNPLPTNFTISNSLTQSNIINTLLSVNIQEICHHMYLDNYGTPPLATNYEYLKYSQFIANHSDLRFTGDGIGSHKEAKIYEYNRWGKAFCRWFLDKHFQISHFLHIDKIFNGSISVAKNNTNNIIKIQRKPGGGDTPDYFCTDKIKSFLGEAKGSANAINFTTKLFGDWRQQFNRVEVYDNNNTLCSIKGYIVATRLVSEKQSSKLLSAIYAEDPHSPGNLEPSQETESLLIQMILAGHYANIFEKLGLNLFAAALNQDFQLPDTKNPYYVVGRWKCLLPSLNNQIFIGGFIYQCPPILSFPFHYPLLFKPLIFDKYINSYSGVFFGLSEQVFDVLTKNAIKTGRESLSLLKHYLPTREKLPDTISILKDGTVFAPVDFFEFVEPKAIY